MVWAAPGKDKATLAGFFDALAASGAAVGEDRCAGITHVSADGADWIEAVVRERCLNAVRCADPFHIVRWAAEALDAVRREAWNTARRGAGGSRYVGAVHGRPQHQAKGYARALKNARWALWQNPENLSSYQAVKLAWIAKNGPRLHRAYLLKEGLRLVFQLPAEEAPEALGPGSAGPDDPGSRRSSTCNDASSNTEKRSSPPSSTACPTAASSRSTPRSA